MPVYSVMPILPMRAGEMPCADGWYVVEGERERFISEVRYHDGHYWFEPSRLRVLPTDTFIARIYPDRIGQE